MLVFRVPWGAEELCWPAYTGPKGQTPERACLSRLVIGPTQRWTPPRPLIFPSPCPPLPLARYLPPPISQQWWESGYRTLTRSVAQYSRVQAVAVLATAWHKPFPSPSLTALPGTSLTPFWVWATHPVSLPQPLWNYLEGHLLASLHRDWQPAPPPSRAWFHLIEHLAHGRSPKHDLSKILKIKIWPKGCWIIIKLFSPDLSAGWKWLDLGTSLWVSWIYLTSLKSLNCI